MVGLIRAGSVPECWRARYDRRPAVVVVMTMFFARPGYRPRLRAMISFWISVVPPKMDWTRLSAQKRPTGYSRM